MTTPRTVAGQAVLSGMRPYVKRAFAHTILAIEAEAIAPYVEALREADRVLEQVAASNAGSTAEIRADADLAERAEATRQILRPLLVQAAQEDDGTS